MATTIILLLVAAWAHSVEVRLKDVDAEHHVLRWQLQSQETRLIFLERDLRRRGMVPEEGGP